MRVKKLASPIHNQSLSNLINLFKSEGIDEEEIGYAIQYIRELGPDDSFCFLECRIVELEGCINEVVPPRFQEDAKKLLNVLTAIVPPFAPLLLVTKW